MALDTFWKNLSNAKRELDDLDGVKRDLRPGMSVTLPRLELWLTPQAVDGFEPDDFWFLTPQAQSSLCDSVKRFVNLVRPLVHDLGGVSDAGARIREAEQELRTILNMVGLEGYRDAQDYRVAKILEICRERLRRDQHPVTDLVHRIEEDSTGEEALWIWVILDDEATKGDEFFRISRRIRSELSRMLRAYGVGLWPFIHFRSRSEQAEAEGEHP